MDPQLHPQVHLDSRFSQAMRNPSHGPCALPLRALRDPPYVSHDPHAPCAICLTRHARPPYAPWAIRPMHHGHSLRAQARRHPRAPSRNTPSWAASKRLLWKGAYVASRRLLQGHASHLVTVRSIGTFKAVRQNALLPNACGTFISFIISSGQAMRVHAGKGKGRICKIRGRVQDRTLHSDKLQFLAVIVLR